MFLRKCLILLCLVLYLSGCNSVSEQIGLPKGSIILPTESYYDVIVVGGEPEGIAAALGASRSGKKTLLIEEGPVLGGLWTLGRLNFLDMNYGPEGELLNQGIFQEFYTALGDAFDINQAIEYFNQVTAQEPLLDVALETDFGKPQLSLDSKGKSIISGLDIDQERKVYGDRFIDATADGDLSAACGVPFTLGGEDYGKIEEKMAATLVFNLKNLNWSKVYIHNNKQRVLSILSSKWGDANAGAKKNLAWGYGQEALKYRPIDSQIRLRGPNIAKQENEEVLINALLIFDVDPLDEESLAIGMQRGQAELPNIISFMQKNFVGFDKAELVDYASRLYIRESRHIIGEYRLSITDVLENRDHWDRIAQGSYPVDIQPTGPTNLGDVIGKPDIYSLPFRCLVPLGVENLLIVGRSASYDSLAHGSARVVPVGIACGEAAGVAASLSIDQEISFRQLSRSEQNISKLQTALSIMGVKIEAFRQPPSKVMEHWAYDGLVVMRELGLASGGYNNQYNLDGFVEYWDIQRILSNVQARILQLRPESEFANLEFDHEVLTKGDMLSKAVLLLKLDQDVEPGELLLQRGILSKDYLNRLKPLNEKPTFAELYWLGAQIFNKYTAD